MHAFRTVMQSFGVQPRVDLRGADPLHAMRAQPGRREGKRVLAPAVVTGPVPGGERGGLVEEEELGPAPPAHDLAAHAAEIAAADDPRLVSPAAAEQGARRRV